MNKRLKHRSNHENLDLRRFFLQNLYLSDKKKFKSVLYLIYAPTEDKDRDAHMPTQHTHRNTHIETHTYTLARIYIYIYIYR